MKTQCPNCKTRFGAGETLIGKKAKCPKCANIFMIQPFEESPIVLEPVESPAKTEGTVVTPQAASTGSAEVIYCQKCGQQNKENNFQCTKCGFVLHGQTLRPVITEAGTMGGLIPHKIVTPIRVFGLLLGMFCMLLWFGGRIEFFFPYDTAIFGGVIVLAALFNQ